MRDRLNAFEMWYYRKMLKIKWMGRITNRAVLNTINTPKRLYPTTQTRTLKFFSHMMRKDELPRKLLDGKVPAKRSRGRPRVV